MTPLHVVFEVPGWISDGLTNQVYERVGGVIRQVATKQVVLWLRPAIEEGGNLIVPHLSSLTAIAGAAVPVVAASALVLAAAGFIWIGRKVDRIEARLGGFEQTLLDIQTDVKWLKQNERWKVHASLEAALQAADTAEGTGRLDKLQAPIMEFHKAQSFYRKQLADILAQPCPLALAPAFVEFAELFVIATQAKGRALALYDNLSRATNELEADASAYADLHRLVLAPVRDPAANLAQLIRLTEAQDDALWQALAGLPGPAEAELLQLPGLSDGAASLAQLRDISKPRRNERPAMIVSGRDAPAGWQPLAA